MPAFSLSDRDVLHEIAEVENALFDGFPATTLLGSHDKTALRIASNRLGVDTQSMRRRIGTPELPGTFWTKFRLSVDWSMYRPRVKQEAALAEPDAAAEPAPPAKAPDSGKLGGSDKDRRIVNLQDEVARLNKELRNSHREANAEDILKEIIGGLTGAARVVPPWITEPPTRQRGKADPEVPMTSWADWHLGETVEADEVNGVNSFNLTIAEARIERLVDKTIMLCRDHHTGNYPGIVVNLVGDFVSGGLHPELKATDEEEVLPSCLKAVDWLIAALTRIADHFGRVYCPCAAGNHGRHTAKPEFKRYYKKNFDWLIYQIVARHFADDKRFTFDIRPSNDVLYRVFGMRFLLTHGDMLGVKGGDGIIGAIGPIMRGEVKKSGQSSAIGQPFDKIVMGHWHQDLWLPRAIVANTLKGFDEYARLQLGAKPTRPSQPLWFVHSEHGMTSHWNIHVDDVPKPPPQPWISIFDDQKAA